MQSAMSFRKTALIAMISLLAGAGLSTAAAAQYPQQPLQPLVVTTGEAVVTVSPDVAYLTVSAESRSRNSADATRMNADIMSAVMQKLQQSGVPKDAVRTLAYDLQPEFDYNNGRQTVRGYVARNTIEVRVDDVTRVGAVIDLVAGAGATSIGAIRFDVRNRNTLEREALKQAVADARARAEAMAAGAGRTIDHVVNISSEDSRFPRPIYMAGGVNVERAAATQIDVTTLEIRARVTLTAALK